MASISDLPQELVDKVVAELHDDPHSLRTCALISRAFVPWSRQHLFSSVRLTASNVYAFCGLVHSTSSVASYVRRLDMPQDANVRMAAILPPATFAQLPNITHLSAHSDPFDFRQLSPLQHVVLTDAARRLTSVEIFIDRLWPLPAWATILDGCPALTTLVLHANATGWATWSAADVAFPMPTAPAPATLRLHTLRVTGDCKILVPLSAWLLPQGALESLHTLVLDVQYATDDYTAPDVRPGLVLAAALSLRELTLHLDPPMSISFPGPVRLASFPRLQVLHLRDGFDAVIATSLEWLLSFLQRSPSSEPSALEELCIDHSMIRRDLLAVPALTWRAIEDALLSLDADADAEPHPHLRTVTFKGYQKFSYGAPGAFQHFSTTVRERLPRLRERGLLVLGR